SAGEHVLVREGRRRVDAVHHQLGPVALEEYAQRRPPDHLVRQLPEQVVQQQRPALGVGQHLLPRPVLQRLGEEDVAPLRNQARALGDAGGPELLDGPFRLVAAERAENDSARRVLDDAPGNRHPDESRTAEEQHRLALDVHGSTLSSTASAGWALAARARVAAPWFLEPPGEPVERLDLSGRESPPRARRQPPEPYWPMTQADQAPHRVPRRRQDRKS